jgi:uncharacterized protein
MILLNKTKTVAIGNKIEIADTSLARLIGLAGRKELNPGCGLLIKPSSGIHTFGMRFSIDVVTLDKALRVMKIWRRLPPFRLTTINFNTNSVLELPAGEADRCQIEVGDQLEIARAATDAQVKCGQTILDSNPSTVRVTCLGPTRPS